MSKLPEELDNLLDFVNDPEKIQEMLDNLYKIEGNVTPERVIVIHRLRQLINEEFIGHKRQITSQTIYNVLKEIL